MPAIKVDPAIKLLEDPIEAAEEKPSYDQRWEAGHGSNLRLPEDEALSETPHRGWRQTVHRSFLPQHKNMIRDDGLADIARECAGPTSFRSCHAQCTKFWQRGHSVRN
jgi:hypothetical protein